MTARRSTRSWRPTAARSPKDLDGAPVYLAKNAWDVGYVSEKNPAIRFTKTKERA